MTSTDPAMFADALVDGHVHYHACFDPVRFLAGARSRFRSAAEAFGLPAATPGVLLFTEGSGENGFGLFRSAPKVLGVAGWTVSGTGEAVSLRACHPADGGIMLIAGRQIACRGRIEVLAPGRAEPYPDGAPVDEVLREIGKEGGPAVLPWGFGKWWGGREKIVREVLDRADPETTFFSDSGTRPRGTFRPRILRDAEAKGFRVLAGSDPLPFPGQEGAAGRFGFRLLRPLDPDTPMASVRRALLEGREFPIWGRRSGWAEFARNQIGMQLRRGRS